MTGREYHNLIVLVRFLQTVDRVRAYIDSCLDSFAIWESDIDHFITRVVFNIVDAVHKSLIQVKDYCFLDVRILVGR